MSVIAVLDSQAGLSDTTLTRGTKMTKRRSKTSESKNETKPEETKVEFLASLAGVLATGLFIIIFMVQAFAIPSSSMENTLLVGDVAPGHRTGEPAFTALRRAFGDRYLYAGLGTTLDLAHTSK